MNRRIILFCFVLFSCFQNSFAQDSTAFHWQVESRRISEGLYELRFQTRIGNHWQLYAPNQSISDISSTELSFTDSSIRPDSVLHASGESHIISNAALGNGSFRIFENEAELIATLRIEGTVPGQLIGTFKFSYGKSNEFYPLNEFPFSVKLEGGVTSRARIKINNLDLNHPVNGCGDEGTSNKSLLVIFLLGFLGGLIALLTPCVFPMIPVTVTFFTKKTEDRKKGIGNALLYGLFIFLIYILITVPFHIAGKAINPEIFNNISTNVWLNLIFFTIFILFALSFFGLFEIGLPSSLANMAGSKSGVSNMAGIFFMAGTLAIVSFSCTGPILGTLLANVATEGPWPLTAGAAGFGLALGLPFGLFALFPNWLHSLPKSGGWMTDVKVVLGFVELALAVKFFTNADNVEQWGIMKREVFIALWAIIGLLIVLYLTGFMRIGHSSPVKKFSPLRIGFILFFGAFTVYLLPALTNSRFANLKLLSGFPPPLSYSIYKHHVLIVRGIKPLRNDYEKALELAQKEHKPILIDFTGWACVNCRRMEEKVWTNQEVDSLMRKEFVVVSLYVDERSKLPATDQTEFKTSSGINKPIVTVGDKWATFQTENFGATSQPQYAIISPDEKVLTKTKYYTPDPADFARWLECGLNAYRK
jgi:thiol:disulfide interchange protein DsbD